MKLAYLSGPVDGVQVHENWSIGRRQDYFGTSFLSEFYEVCAGLGATSLVITTLPTKSFEEEIGSTIVVNRALPARLSGISFHIAMAVWLLRLYPKLASFKPDVLVTTVLSNYWFLLLPLRLLGIRFVPAIHCTLWPKFGALPASWRLLNSANRVFYHFTTAVMAASEDIARQVRLLSARADISVFLPTYLPDQFASITPADYEIRPFRILYAGRLNTSKGVYDLIKIGRSLIDRSAPPFHIDICGEGAELGGLLENVRQMGLTQFVTCHGFCNREKLSQILSRSHAVIVPTTTSFEEGFAMICAEAILAERPLVTSAVCPALEYVRDASVEAVPDDIESYARALMELSTNRDLYESKRVACKTLQTQFYDKRRGYAAALSAILSAKV